MIEDEINKDVIADIEDVSVIDDTTIAEDAPVVVDTPVVAESGLQDKESRYTVHPIGGGESRDIDGSELPSIIGTHLIDKSEIEVESPDGEIGYVPTEKLSEAMSSGFKPVGAQRRRTIKAKEWAKDSPLQREFISPVLRGLTIGLSDIGLSGFDVYSPEEISALREERSFFGEALEVGTDIAVTVLASGALAGPTAGGSVALGGLKILSKIMPAGILGQVGQKVSAGVAAKLGMATAGKGAVAQIAAKGVEVGAGSAVEGAIYGGADLLTESSLGNVEFTAEALFSSMASTGAISGAFGGSIGVGGKSFKTGIIKAANAVDEKAIKGTYKQIIKVAYEGDPEKIKSMIDSVDRSSSIRDLIESMSSGELQKDTLAAYRKLGFKDEEIPKWIISGDPRMVQAGEALMQGTTLIGGKERAMYKNVKDKLNKIAEDVFEGRQDYDFAEVGRMAIDTVITKIDEALSSATRLYKEIEDLTGDVVVTPAMKENIKRQMTEGLRDKTKLDRAGAKQLMKRIDGVKTYKDLSEVITVYNREYQNIKLNQNKSDTVTFLIGERGEGGHEGAISILRRARNEAVEQSDHLTPELKKKLIAGRAEADALYRDIHKQFADTAEYFTGGKTTNMYAVKRELNNLLETKKYDAIASKMVSGSHPELLASVLLDHPEIAKAVRAKFLNDLYSSATKRGDVNIKTLTDAFNKLYRKNKKMATAMFGEQSGVIRNLDAINKGTGGTYNTSKTAYTNDFIAFTRGLLSGVPLVSQVNREIGALVQRAIAMGDFSMLDPLLGKRANTIIKSGEEVVKKERMINRAANGIRKVFKKDFTDASRITATRGIAFPLVRSSKDYSDKDYEEFKSGYDEFRKNPDRIVQLQEAVAPEISAFMPQTSMQIVAATNRAIDFLGSKLPPNYDEYLFDGKRELTKNEKMKFAEYAEAIFKPNKVLEKISQGYVSPRQIEAMRTVYPQMYSQLTNAVLERLPANITAKDKTTLQNLLNMQVKPSLSRANVAILQQNTARQRGLAEQKAEQQQPKQMTSSIRPAKTKMSNREASGLEAITSRRALE